MPKGEAQLSIFIIAETEQPSAVVYVMVVVPVFTAATTPVAEIVAAAVFEDTQGVTDAGVPEPVNCKVEPPTAIFCTPEIVGTEFTFTVIAVRGPSQLVVLFF